MDYSSSLLGCARWNCSKYLVFVVLSVWWKASASGSVLFRTILPHFYHNEPNQLSYLSSQSNTTSNLISGVKNAVFMFACDLIEAIEHGLL